MSAALPVLLKPCDCRVRCPQRRTSRAHCAEDSAHYSKQGELTTEEWKRVIREAAALGVLQIGFSGGEPLARRDLAELIRAAREAKLYTNLITSGIGLDDDRLLALRDAGLDSIQLSFQSDESSLADEIAGARAHERKLDVAAKIRAAGIPLSLNFVIHRRNIDRLPQMIDLAEALGAERVELANVQFYGWAFRNRAALLPTREQVDRARDIATAAKARLTGKIDIFYVLPDYYETRPKPCLNGWGQRYLTVNPIGDVLPCPTASSAIPDLRLENVRVSRSRLDLAGIGKLQSIPWNGMDARAVPELSAKRNRFRRLPLSGRIADRKRCEHRSGLRILAKSRSRGRCAARHKFLKRAYA